MAPEGRVGLESVTAGPHFIHPKRLKVNIFRYFNYFVDFSNVSIVYFYHFPKCSLIRRCVLSNCEIGVFGGAHGVENDLVLEREMSKKKEKKNGDY